MASKRHGQSRPPTGAYKSFHQAKRRCTDPKHDSYISHGALGVKFLYTSFDEFFAELGPRPEGHSLDRIESHGNYEPGNCRWSDDGVQLKNRKSRRTGQPFQYHEEASSERVHG